MGTTESGMTEDRTHKGEFQVFIFFLSQLQAICVLKKLIGSNISLDSEIGSIQLEVSMTLGRCARASISQSGRLSFIQITQYPDDTGKHFMKKQRFTGK
jgi:hypothetical protein